MNRIFILMAFFAFALVSCDSKGQNINLVKPAEFDAAMKNGTEYQLVDVRTPSEYEKGHLEGAQLIDFMKASFKSEIDKLDRSKPILLYCAVGGRSGKAAKQLSKMGFETIYDLKGGIIAWSDSNMKIVKE